MSPENRQLNLDLELRQAQRCLTSAQMLLAGEQHADSVSRSYYAMLHAARALLLTEGLEASTYRGVNALLYQHFVHPGRFPAALARELGRCQDDREAADYDRYAVFDRPMASSALQRAGDFLAACRSSIDDAGYSSSLSP